MVQEEINKLEDFIQKMKTQDEKINYVIQFAKQMQDNDNFAKDKLSDKANNIDEM